MLTLGACSQTSSHQAVHLNMICSNVTSDGMQPLGVNSGSCVSLYTACSCVDRTQHVLTHVLVGFTYLQAPPRTATHFIYINNIHPLGYGMQPIRHAAVHMIDPSPVQLGGAHSLYNPACRPALHYLVPICTPCDGCVLCHTSHSHHVCRGVHCAFATCNVVMGFACCTGVACCFYLSRFTPHNRSLHPLPERLPRQSASPC